MALTQAVSAARSGDIGTQVKRQRVICVDLDGTLLAGDLFWESLLRLAKKDPLTLLRLPLWLCRGKAYAKRQVAARAPIDVSALPYRTEVITFIEQSRRDGHQVVLATGADHSYASDIASHLGLFASVIASNGVENLSGHRKAKCLDDRYGTGRFDYVGNGWVDVPVWEAAGRATVVAAPRRLLRRLRSRLESVHVLVPPSTLVGPMIRAMRPYQWVKNLLVWVPLIAAHRIFELDLVAKTALVLLAFSLCASAVYVTNDLVDIQADRRHPRKRFRPFASGALSIPAGLLLAGGLFLVSMITAFSAISVSVGILVGAYAVTSLAYSLRIKAIPVADVFVLTGLYVMRIVAGGIATGIEISTWLFAFAMFFFLNLALVKRYAELNITNTKEGTVAGRGYMTGDGQWMQVIGVSAGFMAVLVLALYATEPEVTALYSSPRVLFLLCPLMLYWVTRTWFAATRNTVEDDPVLEALRDPASYVGLALGALILMSAR
jgi:4-hydroxybenzoate polyprenyltransferase/phosphoserine phosphatase